MRDFIITSDSTVDIGPERMLELNVPYVSLKCIHKDGEFSDDMTEATAKRIYGLMRDGDKISTSQALADDYVRLWQPILEKGHDIVHLGFSSGLSGSVGGAQLAANMLLDKYPGSQIYVSDSLSASGGQGLLLEHMVNQKKAGLTAEECFRFAEDTKLNVHHWFTVSELTYLRRGGRVKATAAFVADILHIKPVLNMDNAGHLIPRVKVKGRKSAVKRLFDNMCKYISIEKNPFVNITHADCIEDALLLSDMIKAMFRGIKVQISMIGATIGSHSGPGTLALFFIGCPRET